MNIAHSPSRVNTRLRLLLVSHTHDISRSSIHFLLNGRNGSVSIPGPLFYPRGESDTKPRRQRRADYPRAFLCSSTAHMELLTDRSTTTCVCGLAVLSDVPYSLRVPTESTHVSVRPAPAQPMDRTQTYPWVSWMTSFCR